MKTQTLVSDSMYSFICRCGNPSATDASEAVIAGLIVPAAEGSIYRYVTTKAGNEWLVNNAIANGASRQEALRSLDYLDGIGA
jgi:hypothetical protein